MNSITSQLVAGLILISSLSIAQQKTVRIDDILKDAAITGDLVVTGASITDDPGYMRGSKQGLLSIRHLTFRNCTFDNVSIDSIKLQSLKLFDCKGEFLTLIDVSIDTLQAYDTKFNAFSLFTFAQTFTSYANHFTEIFLSNCEIPDFQNLSVDIDDMRIFGPKEMRLTKSRVGTLMTATGLLRIAECQIGSAKVGGSMLDFDVERTTFGSLSLENVTISGLLKIVESHFQHRLEFEQVVVPAENIELPFDQISNGKLYAILYRVEYEPSLGAMMAEPHFMSKDTLVVTFHGMEQVHSAADSTFFQSRLFDRLVYAYQRLNDSYKLRGDVESANACYVELKELERSRLRFRHHEDPTFKSFFRLHLSGLLKVYTDHGTDPAKAIVASVWVVIIFAIFYFFFPSDWDVTSKTRLVQQYKDFIEKNDRGYFKPFVRLAGGIAFSFVNALTLSLNAFTTLGFGNIPTHGLARYVCVLQGFIGWFLLSIFTVALINQALF